MLPGRITNYLFIEVFAACNLSTLLVLVLPIHGNLLSVPLGPTGAGKSVFASCILLACIVLLLGTLSRNFVMMCGLMLLLKCYICTRARPVAPTRARHVAHTRSRSSGCDGFSRWVLEAKSSRGFKTALGRSAVMLGVKSVVLSRSSFNCTSLSNPGGDM